MFGIALDLVYLGIFLAIVFGSWAIYLSVAGTSGMIKLFSKRIPIVNGIFCATPARRRVPIADGKSYKIKTNTL